LDDRGRVPSAVRVVAAAAASGDGLARAALPTRDGRWVVLHGSRVGEGGGVAVVVEGARPVVISEVIAGALGLSPRERDVCGLAAQGRTTRQMAQALGISPFTVQDHLKAVFAKTGVQTRAELVAMLYLQHYEPQRDAGAVPGPYGWYLDDAVPAAG
jgi:DNA-binding CsgD family transcriptional regulator